MDSNYNEIDANADIMKKNLLVAGKNENENVYFTFKKRNGTE